MFPLVMRFTYFSLQVILYDVSDSNSSNCWNNRIVFLLFVNHVWISNYLQVGDVVLVQEENYALNDFRTVRLETLVCYTFLLTTFEQIDAFGEKGKHGEQTCNSSMVKSMHLNTWKHVNSRITELLLMFWS